MATKEKKPVATKTKATGKVQNLDLQQISSNTAQSRGMGVLSNLKQRGYGLFERETPEKDPIWEMLLSEDKEKQAEAVTLISESEPQILKLADAIYDEGQLEAIGVVMDGSAADVIFGMERSLACALNYAMGRGPATVEAKVFEGDFSPVQLKFLALSENANRDDESPMDRAITYKWLMKAGKMNSKALSEQIGYSKQHVDDYLKLTDPKLEDKQMAIHTRKLSVDRALKLLRLRKMTDNEKLEEDKIKSEKNRQRLPGVKTVSKYYDGKFADDVSEEEKQLWLDVGVRKLLAYKLSREFTEKPVVPAAEESNGHTEEPKPSSKVLKVKRERANLLFICLGKGAVRTYSDETVTNMLGDINAYLDSEDQVLEDASLQTLMEKILEANKAGTAVVLAKEKD